MASGTWRSRWWRRSTGPWWAPEWPSPWPATWSSPRGRARFITGFSRLGIIPDAGLTWLLPRRVGIARATEIVYLGEPIDAERACALGLVNEVVAPEALLDRAAELAQRLVEGPTLAFGAAKRVMHRGLELSFQATLEVEGVTQDAVGATADSREGVAAFLAKRSPSFEGR